MPGFAPTGTFTLGQISGTGATPETITMDKWYHPLSLPVRYKKGLKNGLQQFATAQPLNPVVSFGWFENLSERARQKPGFPAREQQVLAFSPFPVVSFGWFEELSKPASLKKLGIDAARQAFFTTSLQPFVSFGWFENLSEPVRFKKGLRASLQQFLAMDTSAIPISRLIAWFEAFSEPPRFKKGLRTSLQQFYAGPAQLRPTPTTFLRLDALETKDDFLGALQVFNRPTTGEVGIIELAFTGAEIGAVTVKPSAGTSGVVTDVIVGSGGSPVPTIGRAGISIRII